MFKDKQFVETPRVDARGQRLSRKAGKQKLQEFYDLAGLDSEKRSAPEEPNRPDLEDAEEQEEESAVEAAAAPSTVCMPMILRPGFA